MQRWTQDCKRWWTTRAPRERLALIGMGSVVGAALLWSVALVPAWRTLQTAPAQQRQLEQQLQTMRAQAAQALELKNNSGAAPSADAARQAVIAATQRQFGQAVAPQFQGDQVTVSLPSVTASELAAWLEEVRVNARMVPTEVRLNRVPAGESNTADADALWSGSIALTGGGATRP